MQRDWGTFFREVFEKSPVIATCILVGLGLGGAYGLYCVQAVPENEGRMLFRILFYFVCGMGLVGAFIGLVLGVIVDYAFSLFRDEKAKKKKKKKRSRTTV